MNISALTSERLHCSTFSFRLFSTIFARCTSSHDLRLTFLFYNSFTTLLSDSRLRSVWIGFGYSLRSFILSTFFKTPAWHNNFFDNKKLNNKEFRFIRMQKSRFADFLVIRTPSGLIKRILRSACDRNFNQLLMDSGENVLLVGIDGNDVDEKFIRNLSPRFPTPTSVGIL